MSLETGKILITGGAGFIGSHLAEALLKNENKVIVIDNLSSGLKSNLQICYNKKNFEFVEEDIKNIEVKSSLLNEVKTVFHIAAYPEVRTGYDTPELAYEQNVKNTFIMLENLRKFDIEKFVFASSSVVYGEPEILPTPENYGPLLPISVYGGSKLACEGLISAYCHTYGIKGTIVRFANVIGSRSRHGVIWDFIKKLENNQNELEILGNGKQVKSYIHVDDCINAILFCVDNSKNQVDVFNIGNKDQIDVLNIGSIVCKSLDLENVQISTKGGTKDGRGWIGDIKNMQLDISKVTSLGWVPKLNSKQSVEKATIEIINENKDQSP